MDRAQFEKVVKAVADAVIAHSDELTTLDRAIGDGDHGVNMKRGFDAVLANLSASTGKSLGDSVRAIGMTLVTTVGGASGPLYGTLFLGLGEHLPGTPSRADAVDALGRAIAAVQARGKAEPGQKTLLDVLVPVHAALAEGANAARVRAVAAEAAAATVPMKATRGRASFLGDRSIGHMDPGARSSQLMIDAAITALEGR